MARLVPGSGAVIEPIFDDIFGVRAVRVVNGGSGYDPMIPRLTMDAASDREAILYQSLQKVLVKLFTFVFSEEEEDRSTSC